MKTRKWKAEIKKAERKTRAKKCGCREPQLHDDCMYCGKYWAGEVVCGVCRENGIDGRLIRGTGRRVCAEHKGAKR